MATGPLDLGGFFTVAVMAYVRSRYSPNFVGLSRFRSVSIFARLHSTGQYLVHVGAEGDRSVLVALVVAVTVVHCLGTAPL